MSDDVSQVSDRAAEFYEEYLLPALFEQWTGVVLDTADVGPGHRVLDVACGTGVLARAAATRVGSTGSVAGLDRNTGMLAVARSTAPRIDWREGLAEGIPYRTASSMPWCHSSG